MSARQALQGTALLALLLLGCLGGAAMAAERISPEQALAIAVNHLSRTDDGFRLEHPQHVATFTADGVRFAPLRSEIEWCWRYDIAGSLPALPPAAADARPAQSGRNQVSYRRGALEERYILGADHIEQQFVLTAPVAGGGDLVINGLVQCNGILEQHGQGWLWTTPHGVVSLGDVRVADAAGREIPASLTVRQGATRIVVDGTALATAEYPVTVDPEIGSNDFRLSDMGIDGDVTYDGQRPAVAYDPTGNQYLVVWEGDDDGPGLGDGAFEIFGQRIDATTGAEIGANDFRISDMGPDGDAGFDATEPAVAYNAANREFLVVWTGDNLVNGESEIWGQRISAITGLEVGVNDFRISDAGPEGDPLYDAVHPAVADNSTQGEYLVVWEADDNTGGLVEGETEIFAQRLTAGTGAEVGANDFRVSDMGLDGDPLFDGDAPAVAWGSAANEYLVVWEGDDNLGGMVDGEFEVFGQRLSAAGAEVGTNDMRLSDMGPAGNPLWDATAPAVTYAGGENEFLVVWAGDDNTGGLADDEFEIFAQRVAAASGVEAGSNDQRVSNMGNDGDPLFDALLPAVAYNPAAHEYLVTWEGDSSGSGLNEGEYEIFGQRLSAVTGAEVGTNDFRLSDMGTDGDVAMAGLEPCTVFASGPGEFLIAWQGDDDTVGLSDDEFEIWGQRVIAATGIETGVNDFRLSDMGLDGDIDWDADVPGVAYNADDNQYLIVWQGDDNSGTLVDGETEIFGQRVDAATGAEIGANDFRVSDMGPNGDPAYDSQSPAAVYNRTSREYLVVWAGEDNTGLLVNGEFEIYGQRLSGATGLEVGTNDFRISDMGADGNDLFDAGQPAVAWNSVANEYLVVWEGDDATPPLVDEETEIFGQFLSAAGTEIGINDFRISDMGSDGDPNFDAAVPALAFDPVDNQYLVVWAGEDNTGLLVNGEFEIYGQRLSATGLALGTNDFRITDMGPDGDPNFDAFAPAVAFDPSDDQYLVVWEGEDNALPLVNGEFEIFGQRLAGATGAAIGANDFRISDMGPDGDPVYDAQAPSVAFDAATAEYIVVWEGDDDTGLLVDGETEIFGQRITAATGVQVGDNDFRLSDMGPDGNGLFDARSVAVAAGGGPEVLVVWSGEDQSGVLGTNEFEVYGQRYLTGAGVGVAETEAPAHGRLAIAAVSPNPMRAYARLDIVTPSAGPIELRIFDLAGRAVTRRVESARSGANTIALDIAHLPSGAYFARVSMGLESATARLMVVK